MFDFATGVRQSGVLLSFLFRFYVKDIIKQMSQMKVGCNIGDVVNNLLYFTDDMILFALAWSALIVCMDFDPTVSSKVVSYNFPAFTAGVDKLEFVDKFKCLGNIVTKDLIAC